MARTTIQGSFLGLASQAAGDVMYFDGTNWIRLAKGSADEVLTMNDGASAPGWEVAGGGGAVVRVASNTDGSGEAQNVGETEATSVSTSALDLLRVTGLTIGATVPIKIQYVGRKTSGAADNAGTGYALNNTTIAEANPNGASGYGTTTTDRAEMGGVDIYIGPRLTNYTGFAIGSGTNKKSAFGADNDLTTGTRSRMTVSANLITGTINDVDIRGITDNTANTLGADEMHIYTFAIS